MEDLEAGRLLDVSFGTYIGVGSPTEESLSNTEPY